MIGSQLGRVLLATAEGSPDQQSATTDERGRYDQLTIEIDAIVLGAQAEPGPGEDQSR